MKKKKKENKNEKNLILERYIYPIDFAETWFNLLQERIIDNNLLEKFIKELGDYTLIGESVRDKKREHVLVYKNRDIIFYAIVNNKKLLSENYVHLPKNFYPLKKNNLSIPKFNPVKNMII